jgi:hypothetical protein
MNKEGKPAGPSGRGIYTKKMMTADQCAQIVLRVAYRRKREVLMWPGPLAVWLKLVAPGLLDMLVVEAFLRPAISRVSRRGEK